MKKKTVALLCSCALLAGVAMNSTMAWLTSTSGPVTNTFTVGDININLKEHDYNPANGELTGTLVEENNDYKFVPGDTLPKDPFVTVAAGSEDCWLFVCIKEQNNSIGTVDKIVGYTVSSLWTPVEGHAGFYYYNGNSATAKAGDTFEILVGNEVTISPDVTKEMVATINGETTHPQLIFTAAAVQKDNVGSLEAAWKYLPVEFLPAATPQE